MPADSDKRAAAQQAVDILHEISTILNCHLDRRTLSICISMIERGVNPEAMAVSPKKEQSEAKRGGRSGWDCLAIRRPRNQTTDDMMQQVIKELRQEAQRVE
ncbi:hypothetical protein JDV02_006451 [Purpureocillium takamizusanense]|uniref:Mitotic-spindle organizing protein 1 n=1 Tax=Purpureocillium takamizusanense TaxID=2060973 RepID=A0A9Q8VD06_9HYPO|nr:uncharacterized protein JDV02_006451 [Purpureocillium takamizusanense]UNI20357.1 hypothetical protein JDV02_006451 [Purpureocillium takamizusanense]